MRVIVVGGGIAGVSSCYYLVKKAKSLGISIVRNTDCAFNNNGNGMPESLEIILIEREHIACAASGKAGGLIGGAGWGDYSTDGLHQKGYELHQQLGTELGIESYREISAFSMSYRKQKKKIRKPKTNDEKSTVLLKPEVCSLSNINANTAQVTPKELLSKMWAFCEANGVQFVSGEAKLVLDNSEIDKSDRIHGPIYSVYVNMPSGEERAIRGECILANGPWIVAAEDWLKIPVPLFAIASSSVIIENPSAPPLSPQVCFCGEDSETRTHLELYPRPDNSLYICGIGGSPHLEKASILNQRSSIPFNESRKEALHLALSRVLVDEVLPSAAAKEAYTYQCCMRPCPFDARPIIGKVGEKARNVTLIGGLNCWGITWGPACGWIVAQQLLQLELGDIDISDFSPNRFNFGI